MNTFVTKYSGQDFMLPEQLLGSSEVKLDAAGQRLAIPSVWKDSFDERAYMMASVMGAYPCSLVFPESNIKGILAQIQDDDFREILERSANPVAVDSQKRIVIPEHLRFFNGGTVSIFGSGSHLKLIDSSAAQEIAAEDSALLAHFFRDIT